MNEHALLQAHVFCARSLSGAAGGSRHCCCVCLDCPRLSETAPAAALTEADLAAAGSWHPFETALWLVLMAGRNTAKLILTAQH